MTENYEALGRYVAKLEVAEKLKSERNKYLSEAAGIIGRSTGGIHIAPGRFAAFDFDPQLIQEKIEKAFEVHQRLLAAVDDANAQADLCGKPKLEIEPLRTNSRR